MTTEKDGTKTEADYLEYGYNDKQVILKQYVLGADGTWKLNPHFGNDGNVMAEKVADGCDRGEDRHAEPDLWHLQGAQRGGPRWWTPPRPSASPSRCRTPPTWAAARWPC